MGLLLYPDLQVGVENLEMKMVTDLDEWEALPYEWRGPLWCEQKRAESSSKEPSSGTKTLAVAVATSDPIPLLAMAVHRCFWKLPMSFLKRLCAHLGVSHPGGTLYEVLETLIKHTKGSDMAEQELLNIMHLRVPPTEAEDAIDIQVWQECVPDEDVEDYTTADKEESAEKDGTKSFVSSVGKLRASVKMKEASKPVKKRKVKDFSEYGALTEAEARLYAPDGVGVGKDRRNGRWWCRDTPFSISRSFVKYGEKGSLALCLVAAWKWVGRPCPFKSVIDSATAASEQQ
eukprot:6456145-Amphidinium_carterae.1